MVQITKPNDLHKIWADGGDRATPLDSKISTGWTVEIPPRQWFNWLDNRQDRAIAHINQHGIPVWDSVTEYQANKSYVQDPTNGLIYRCKATHVGIQPSSSSTHWAVAFADAATAFSEGQADAKYLKISGNLADVPNKAAARANLGVPSVADVNNASVRGFIAFNGVTGAVYSSKNMSLATQGVGNYILYLNGAAYRGSSSYTAIIGSVEQPTYSQSYSQSNGAHNTKAAWIHSRTASYIQVLSILRQSRLDWNGKGNDGNDSHAMAVSLSGSNYISVAVYW